MNDQLPLNFANNPPMLAQGYSSVSTESHDENINGTVSQVMYIYPPTEEPSLVRLLITMYLIACLTIGICGNFSQLTLQYYAYRLRSSDVYGTKTYAQLYICLLHIVYFSISISLPSVIIEHLIQIWMFGIFSCVTYLILVTVGRTAAAWLTVMLFVDQLLTTLKIDMPSVKSRQKFYVSLAFISAVCIFSSLPSIVYISLTQEIMHEQNMHGLIVKVRTYKCSTSPPEIIAMIARPVSFLIDCMFPMIAIIVCLIVSKIKPSILSNSTNHSLRKQNNLQLAIALLYFLGNSLQWIAVASYHLGNPTEEQSVTLADLAILFQYTLPAVIWVPLSILSSTLSSHNNNIRNQRRYQGTYERSEERVPRSLRWSAGEMSLLPLMRHSQATATATATPNANSFL